MNRANTSAIQWPMRPIRSGGWADVILVPIKRIGGFASIGDVLLGLGCGALFVSWMRTEEK